MIDADDLARGAVAPGTDGRSIGSSRRSARDRRARRRPRPGALGAIVFADPERRRALEAIVHPEVARLFVEAVDAYRDTDQVVVYSVPLLVERGLVAAFDVVVVIVVDIRARIERVVRAEALEPREVRAPVAAQASDEERAGVADVLLDNDGDARATWRRRSIGSGPTSGRASAGSGPPYHRRVTVAPSSSMPARRWSIRRRRSRSCSRASLDPRGPST